MAAGVRKQVGERLDKSTLDKVQALLEGDTPITKKAACEMLAISYNTKRLASIMEGHIAQKDFAKRRRKILRTKAVSIAEKKDIVQMYLIHGEALSAISDSTYRSIATIKNVLSSYGIPLRTAESTYQMPVLLPDKAISDDYELGDLVYSARYNEVARIESKLPHAEHGMCYKLYIGGDYCRYAHQPWWELGDLRKAQSELGLEMKDNLTGDEVKRIMYEALAAANKLNKSKR